MPQHDSLRKGIRYWFSADAITYADSPKGRAEHDQWALKQQKLIDAGYVIESNGVYYKEVDILAGNCPLNGVLYHMGYRRNSDGKTWRKK